MVAALRHDVLDRSLDLTGADLQIALVAGAVGELVGPVLQVPERIVDALSPALVAGSGLGDRVEPRAKLGDDSRGIVAVQAVLLSTDPGREGGTALLVASASRVPQLLQDVHDVDR